MKWGRMERRWNKIRVSIIVRIYKRNNIMPHVSVHISLKKILRIDSTIYSHFTNQNNETKCVEIRVRHLDDRMKRKSFIVDVCIYYIISRFMKIHLALLCVHFTIILYESLERIYTNNHHNKKNHSLSVSVKCIQPTIVTALILAELTRFLPWWFTIGISWVT